MSLFQTKEKDGTINIIVNGYLTKDPRVFEKDGAPSIVSFSVCYGKKKYMDCKVWAGNKELFALACCLEQHDVVSVSGEYGTHTGKDGKEYSQVSVDFITVLQQAPQADMPDRPSYGAVDCGFQEIEEEDSGELPF